jgi:hypothetical protein
MARSNKVVNVGLLYNAFDPSDVIKEELVYKKNKPLAHYIVGLPDTCDWAIGLNGVPVKPEDYKDVILAPDDTIQIVSVPRGSGAKDILRLIALVAVVVVAAYLFGPLAAGGLALAGSGLLAVAAFTAFVAIGSFLVNMAIPPSGIKTDSQDDGQSYGYDGAKNTAKEGVAIPVVYGLFHVAGNYVDLRTENVGDDQYLYGRVVLSDGEIDSIVGVPELNEQPVTNFKDIEWGFTAGTLTENENPKFSRSVSVQSRNDLLTTSYTTFTTTTPVEGFQINTVFPRGLVQFDDKGTKKSRSVTIEISYSPHAANTWTSVGGNSIKSTSTNALTGWVSAATGSLKTKGDDSTWGTGTSYDIQYRVAGSGGAWTTYTSIEDISYTYVQQPYFGDEAYRWDYAYPDYAVPVTQGIEQNTYIALSAGSYEFQVTNGATIELVTTYKDVAPSTSFGNNATTSVTYTDQRARAIRKTHEVTGLSKAVYDIKVRRTTVESTDEKTLDQVYLVEVGEILNTNVALRSIATGFFKAKMTDQFQSIPNILWYVKGVKMPIYDVNGTVTSTAWSDNPADIVLDMLISPLRGALVDRISIDFGMFQEWRDFCEDNSLKFNGIFDETTSLWDAMSEVFRCGRATPTRLGTKLSVAIDRPSEPVMLFGPGNIFKDSFNISYLPLTDRANEFEVSYFDKEDRNKQKTLRIADPAVVHGSEIPKTAAYQLRGVDNFEQAQKEIWYQLYNNRLAKRTITFDAPVESIGLSIGDVALIQHDMVNWGTAGRLKQVTSSSIVTLDKEVTIESGETYKLLVIHDKVSRLTFSGITHVTGNTYTLTGVSNPAATEDECDRIQTNTGAEAAVLAYEYQGSSTSVVTLDRTVTGASGTIWGVDVIEESTVTTGVSTTATITVSPAFAHTPSINTNYSFGIAAIVKKPYRLRSINGEGFDRRTLMWGEYNELVYSDPETDIPAPVVRPPKYPENVKNLTVVQEPFRSGSNLASLTVSWTSGNILKYGGADIYVAKNQEDFKFKASVLNTNEYHFDAQDSDVLRIKVVAFNTTSLRANINTAPQVSISITSAAGTLAPPTDFVWTLESLDFTGSGLLSWTKPDQDATNNSGPYTRVWLRYYPGGIDDAYFVDDDYVDIGYVINTLTGSDAGWIDKGLQTEPYIRFNNLLAGTYLYRLRTENGSGAVSEVVTGDFVIAAPTLVAPTIANDGTAIDHVLNADGSADISFEWSWAGTNADIDGLEVIVYSSTSSSAYTLGTTPAQENSTIVGSNIRAVFLRGVAASNYYTFYVRAIKRMDASFATDGIVRSTAVKSVYAGENPYRPSSTVAFTGDLIGTIDLGDLNVWSEITGVDKPEDNADVTSYIQGVTSTTIACDYLGAAKAGQVNPRYVFFTLLKNGVDETASATWAATVTTGTASVSISNTSGSEGRLNITSVTTNATVTITATFSTYTRTFYHTITRSIDPPPSGGGGGSSSTSGSIGGTVTSTAYTAIGDELTIVVGASGSVSMNADYTFSNTSTTTNASVMTEWYKWNGSAYVALTLTATPSDSDWVPFYGLPGAGGNYANDGGNTVGSTQKYKLYGTGDASETTYYSGSCSLYTS